VISFDTVTAPDPGMRADPVGRAAIGATSRCYESVAESGNVAWQRGEQICRAELSAFRLILMVSDRCRRWQDERLSRW
jgi:hypothetical protein